MAQPVLIAVGGSGQNVLAAYLRLAAMAGFPPAICYVLDSDNKGPQFRALSDLERRVRGLIGGSHNSRWMINPFPVDRSGLRSFGELFSHPNAQSRQVFECLFSEEAEKTSIRDGMYGRPAIGATSMRLKLERDDDDLREMKRMLEGDQRHIVLVGSCFGGTGSGVVPILAQEFSRLSREPGFDLRVQSLVFLPWFRLELPEGDMEQDQRLLHDHLDRNFEPNAASSIRFFKDTLRDYVETVVFLGMRDPSTVRRQSQEWRQSEAVHALNLLAAVLVHNLFAGHVQAPRGITGYWYDPEKGLDAPHLEVAAGKKPTVLTQVIRRGALHQRWMEILEVFFRNYPKIPPFHRPLFLDLALERMRDRSVEESELTDEIAKFFAEGKEAHAEIQEWIDSMVDKSFFLLEAEEKQLQSAEYRSLLRDPLPFIKYWTDDEDTVRKFDDTEFAHPRVFAARFAERFLGYVNDHLAQ
jgi:hypothetical protein